MHYIPPEQIYGEQPDERADLYAMGVTLYEMITGKLPIEGANYPQVIANHLQHPPVPPHQINPRVPELLSLVTMKALDKDKRNRWQSAREFLAALDHAYPDPSTHPHGAFVTATPHTPTPVTPHAAQPTHHASGTGSKYQPEQLSEISHKLANYVGPIASVLVKRASSSSNNLRELCDQVAAEIESDDARQKFLASVRGQLRSSGLL